jgi:hypothetical protein
MRQLIQLILRGGITMPKPEKKVIIIGDPLPELDVRAVARVILNFARGRQARFAPPQDAVPTSHSAGPGAAE